MASWFIRSNILAMRTSSQKYSPLDWLGYFDQEDDIHIQIRMILSFALAASKLKEKSRVVAMDLRGHGKSSTENELDLSIENIPPLPEAATTTPAASSPPARESSSNASSSEYSLWCKKPCPIAGGFLVSFLVFSIYTTSIQSMRHVAKTTQNSLRTCQYDTKTSGGGLLAIRESRRLLPAIIGHYRPSIEMEDPDTDEEAEQYARGFLFLSQRYVSCAALQSILQCLSGHFFLVPSRGGTVGHLQGTAQSMAGSNKVGASRSKMGP
ncbi:hypothetical protein LOK49_LG10G00234, partial [Camellia lanceoleosa]